jgi:hypothetical protein
MPDYQNGKIYQITGNGKTYIGSTCEKLLCQRMTNHRRCYKLFTEQQHYYLTAFEVLSDPECVIELVELFPCTCLDELRKREGFYIRETNCVNKLIAGRTIKEYYLDNKDVYSQYYLDNKERIKAYYQANKESISKRQKQYYLNNKKAMA